MTQQFDGIALKGDKRGSSGSQMLNDLFVLPFLDVNLPWVCAKLDEIKRFWTEYKRDRD